MGNVENVCFPKCSTGSSKKSTGKCDFSTSSLNLHHCHFSQLKIRLRIKSHRCACLSPELFSRIAGKEIIRSTNRGKEETLDNDNLSHHIAYQEAAFISHGRKKCLLPFMCVGLHPTHSQIPPASFPSAKKKICENVFAKR